MDNLQKKTRKYAAVVDRRMNIEALHDLQLRKFQQDQAGVGKMKETREAMARQRDALPPGRARTVLDEELATLDRRIRRIETRADEFEYVANTAGFLREYYDVKNAQELKDFETSLDTTGLTKRKILHRYLNYVNLQMAEVGLVSEIRQAFEQELAATGSTDYIHTGDAVAPSIVTPSSGAAPSSSSASASSSSGGSGSGSAASEDRSPMATLTACASCNGSIVCDMAGGSAICSDCGRCVEDLLMSAEPSYKEKSEHYNTRVQKYCYKRMTHFNNWLNRIQGRENDEIPAEVLDALRDVLTRHRIPLASLTHEKVRTYLKKIGANNYYDHVVKILGILTGRTLPRMTDEMVARMQAMFEYIQGPFEYYKTDRDSFFSYPYIIYKFCQLLRYNEFLPYCPLLKSRDKLQQYDHIWRNITRCLGWEFIKTV